MTKQFRQVKRDQKRTWLNLTCDLGSLFSTGRHLDKEDVEELNLKLVTMIEEIMEDTEVLAKDDAFLYQVALIILLHLHLHLGGQRRQVILEMRVSLLHLPHPRPPDHLPSENL